MTHIKINHTGDGGTYQLNVGKFVDETSINFSIELERQTVARLLMAADSKMGGVSRFESVDGSQVAYWGDDKVLVVRFGDDDHARIDLGPADTKAALSALSNAWIAGRNDHEAEVQA